MGEKDHQNSEMLFTYLLQSKNMNLADMQSSVMLSVPGILAVILHVSELCNVPFFFFFF